MSYFIKSAWATSGFTTRRVTIVYWGRILKALTVVAIVIGLCVYGV